MGWVTVPLQGAIFADELCLVREGWACKGTGSSPCLPLLGENLWIAKSLPPGFVSSLDCEEGGMFPLMPSRQKNQELSYYEDFLPPLSLCKVKS